MNYTVNAQELGKIRLNESDKVASVLQNIAVILSTSLGSVPLYRDFGLPRRFQDKPIPVAKQMMIAEIQEAIVEHEPRATLTGVTFEVDASAPGKLIPTVEVEINE